MSIEQTPNWTAITDKAVRVLQEDSGERGSVIVIGQREGRLAISVCQN
jgi:hypothetical protein